MRCIALAQAWQDRGGKVTFLSHCESEGLKERILTEGFEFLPLDKVHPDPFDLEQTLSLLAAKTNEDNQSDCSWFVLDGYHFTTAYQKSIRTAKINLLVIDDLNHLPHYHADIILNQNSYAPDLDYNCDKDTTLLLGTNYVLLRSEFFKYEDFKRQISERAKNILVTFGGADPDNVTFKTVNALKFLDVPDIMARIVVGPANPHIEALNKVIASACFRAEILINPSNMPELMAWADIAVSAGGSTCWELAFMGLPNIIVAISDNQSLNAKAVGNVGAGIYCGWHEDLSLEQYALVLKEIEEDKSKRSYISRQGKRLVDGKGRQRIIRAMLSERIKLRIARASDCKLLWKWVNDPEVRKSAFNSKDIAWEDHQSWFLKKQNETNSFQYIALDRNNIPIGQIRFDIKDAIAESDYSIDKDFRGLGLGRMLLEKGIALLCETQKNPIIIRGCVRKENKPSRRTFKSIGFLETIEKSIDENGITNKHEKIVYQLHVVRTR